MDAELGDKVYSLRGGEFYLAGDPYYDEMLKIMMRPCNYFDGGTEELEGNFPESHLHTKSEYVKHLQSVVLHNAYDIQLAIEANNEYIMKLAAMAGES